MTDKQAMMTAEWGTAEDAARYKETEKRKTEKPGDDGEMKSERASRQGTYSFITVEAARWQKSAPGTALCAHKFYADFLAAAEIIPQRGQLIADSDKGIFAQVTKSGKDCYKDCLFLRENGKPCPLKSGVFFAEPVGGGDDCKPAVCEADDCEASQPMPKVLAVCISKRKGEQKHPVESIELKLNYGITGDAHAGNWHRQVSLLGMESVDRARKSLTEKRLTGEKSDFVIKPGDFAENILTEGIVLYELPVGTLMSIGSAVLQVTQIGKECHQGCKIRELTGDCVMPREGIFAKVIREGGIRKGDNIRIFNQMTLLEEDLL